MHDKIGLYDIRGSTLKITVWGCFNEQIRLSNERDTQPYKVVDGVVVITDPPIPAIQLPPARRSSTAVLSANRLAKAARAMMPGWQAQGGMGDDDRHHGMGGGAGEMIIGPGGNTGAGTGAPAAPTQEWAAVGALTRDPRSMPVPAIRRPKLPTLRQ